MNLDDIPVIRHIPLAGEIFKVGAVVFALGAFPLITLEHMYQFSQAETVARKGYEAFKTILWFGMSYLFWFLAVSMYHGFKGDKDYFYGQGHYLSTWMTSAEPNQKFMYDISIVCIMMVIGWFGAAACGHKDSDDMFVGHW